MNQENFSLAIQIVEDLLSQLGLKSETEADEENEKLVVTLVDCEPSVLIGHRGEILDSFQYLTKVIFYKRIGDWPSLTIETAGYRESREKAIREMTLSTIQEVKNTDQAYALPYLSPFERRIVHLLILEKNEKEVFSQSEGEGRERRVIIRPIDQKEPTTTASSDDSKSRL